MEPRQIVIGDIHGCIKTFDRLIRALNIKKCDRVYLLGDYIDRGPDSKKVVDRILDYQKDGYSFFPIIGNHEAMLLDSLNSNGDFISWLCNGAESTLRSFGVKTPDKIDEKYINFFKSLPFFIELDAFILVHGGLNFSSPAPLSDVFSMVWQRSDFVDRAKIQGRRLIVGHTPKTLEEIESSLSGDCIFLDGGCVYHGKTVGLGYLCALEIPEMKLSSQINIDI